MQKRVKYLNYKCINISIIIILGECDEALGMESGAIPDSAITASSSYNVPNVGPSNGR